LPGKPSEFIEYVERLGRSSAGSEPARRRHAVHGRCDRGAADRLGPTAGLGLHRHYNRGNFYNEVMESVSGLPLNVTFISFETSAGGVPTGVSVIINAGAVDDAWSGGEHWADARIIEALSEYVHGGGGLIGVGEPSALRHSSQYFQLSHLLGVDRELGLTRAFQRLDFAPTADPHFILKDAGGELDFGTDVGGIYVLDGETHVLAARGKSPMLTTRPFGQGGR
jgi:beta-D-galactosyl-(1->4)-L-rhamnose phosphorylase